MTEELIIVRRDNGTGAETLCTWARAEEMIRDGYVDPESTLRDLAIGHPIRCTFATYQRRIEASPNLRGNRDDYIDDTREEWDTPDIE